MVQEINWLKKPEQYEVITKNKLLKDIKTNMISLLNDYKGRGFENENELIEEVRKMFTGGVVPSIVDWRIINVVLKELSTIKEQGKMYQHFIRDVSSTLGVDDLLMIRNFIEYIATLAPVVPKIDITVGGFEAYSINAVSATFQNNINSANLSNQATVNWTIRDPAAQPEIVITINDSPSEDIENYQVVLKAGKHIQRYTLTGKEMDKKVHRKTIAMDTNKWFESGTSNLVFELEVVAIDKRGNRSETSKRVLHPASAGVAKGFSYYEVQYLPTAPRGWQTVANRVSHPKLNHGPFTTTKVDGNHRFKVRGYDSGMGWSAWVESPDYRLMFRDPPIVVPDPIPEPEPEP